MTPAEQRIKDEAIEYARRQKKAIARKLTDKNQFPPDAEPVSIFMAGSPGAGKTEASKALIRQFRDPPVRIDPDELRSEFQDYNGRNSWLFQPAAAILVERIHDHALKNGQNFILDGTLSSLDKARSNIERSLKRDRCVQILYVYQEPALAWRFVCAREAEEGRRIEPDTFVAQYFAARSVVNQLKMEFGQSISVDLILKNHDNSDRVYKDNIDKVDHHLPEKYTAGEVRTLTGG